MKKETIKEPTYDFDAEKNEKLISLRGISFEEIIAALGTERLLDIIDHPNQEKYSHQRMYVVKHNDYAFLVPFVEKNNKIFLKTAFPNRQATKYYLNRGGK